MRLTLRTLLAYLDNTVEPEDAELLRKKLEQSGFATQLVSRIRSSVTEKGYSAPAPDSVHPIEEPNLMSEYLDSVLPPEQVAEIEKACLESEPHLAEAAGCHQILTMIMGEPANTTEALRERIYSMVDMAGNVIAAPDQVDSPPPIAGEIGPRTANELGKPTVAISDPTDLGAMNRAPAEGFAQVDGQDAVDREAPTADIPGGGSFDGLSIDAPQAVPPVGVDDSGVFEAATKLRVQSFATPDAGATLDETERLAGDRPLRLLEKSDFYEGDVRPSRITPWLVSLALVGVLLFAIGQIFKPLLNPKVASNEDANISESFPEVESEGDTSTEPADQEITVPPDQSPPMTEVGETMPESEDIPVPASKPALAEDNAAVSTSEPAMEDMLGPEEEPESSADLPLTSAETPDVAEVGAAASSDLPAPDAIMPTEPVTDAMAETSDAAEDASAEPVAVATLVSKDALVGRSVDDTWQLLPAGGEVLSGDEVVCGPEYRADFQWTDGTDAKVTLVGPARVGVAEPDGGIGMRIAFGKGIVQLQGAGQTLRLVAAEKVFTMASEGEKTLVAFELVHRREIGADPMIPENHAVELRLLPLSGNFAVDVGDLTSNLIEGERATFDLSTDELGPPETQAVEPPPAWLDPETDTGTLESEAASNLLELVGGGGNDSLLLSLRVALAFRRHEVVALAGKTMLCLGDATAYFGADGLLSQARQRLYWESHLKALRDMVDRSDADAILVRKAIAGNEAMDDADGDTLFRLLVGFSQDQLQTGGDAELVEGLESASMPVRVLASENLREISGTTLSFRPEESVASRREEVVKKWNVRLRKESIRWPAPVAEAAIEKDAP